MSKASIADRVKDDFADRGENDAGESQMGVCERIYTRRTDWGGSVTYEFEDGSGLTLSY